jgi:hypothetical protein
MSKLKHCPFCGEAPEIRSEDWYGYGWCVECCNKKCMVQVHTIGYKTKQGAINTWNRRAK